MDKIKNFINPKEPVEKTTTINTTNSDNKKNTIKDKKYRIKKFAISSLSIVLILVTVIATFGFFFVFVPGKKLLAQINRAKSEGQNLQLAISDKDLNRAKDSIVALKSQTNNIESTYKRFSFTSIIPFIGSYYKDGIAAISIAKESLETGEILIQVIEPYKDFLGIKGGSVSGEQTTEDRIEFLTQSIESLIPHMDVIEEKVANIETSLEKINPNRYPEEFRGYQIRSNLLKAQDTIIEAHKFIKDGKPILSKTSWLLGKDAPRTYLMIYQNDAELRPTGGFWTAYGMMKIDNGKIIPLASDDIYTLDAKIKSTIPAPRPIKDYHINVSVWNVRDMNISPDFPTSIELFLENYKKVYKTDHIDAVIALDTRVLVDIVRIIGQVGVSGFGNFSAEPDSRCDGCPQIFYELEYIASKPKSYIDHNRKGFLSPLMNSLLSNAMGAEKSKIGPLAEGMIKNIHEKHILFYFIDPEMQKAAELANIAGNIVQTDTNIDYIHLNDANMSSAKTNIFLEQKIKHELNNKNGKVEHKLTVTYTNPSRASNCNLEKGDLCLNAPKYRNWFRFYVPTGSKLIKMTGSEVEPVIYEEINKQVFEGFYGNKYPLYAQSSLKTSIQYESSVPATSNYVLYLQKQPGTKPVEYELIVNGQKHDIFSWVADKTIKLSL